MPPDEIASLSDLRQSVDTTDINFSNESLLEVSELVKRQSKLENEVEDMEEALKERKERLKHVSEKLLPDALAALNLSRVSLEDGTTIEVKQFYSAKIPEECRAEAFAWLDENGHGSLVKTFVSVPLERTEREKADKLTTELVRMGFSYQQKDDIHPMRLRGFVREQIEEGPGLPMELFGVYVGRQAKIVKK